ncbi:hypothetical protein GCM10022222_66760 [Amycolatopsis ultiminotia]|uniref:Uncharacterized protein n=1 Tax=Amycolatopsis ultiminotia TaxID=543629 RepID=A0ABP6XWS8_9PSEU
MNDDAPPSDLIRLLRRFGVRVFALAFVAGITGLTMLALALALAGFALVLAPAAEPPVRPAARSTVPLPPDS